MNFELLKEKISSLQVIEKVNHFQKLRVETSELLLCLNLLKNMPEFSFDILNSIIAVDLLGVSENFIEVIYDLYSTKSNASVRISVLTDRILPRVPSVVSIFKSAHFDECEAFDMFGIEFTNNPQLKRLFMPKGWIGHPLKKDYKFEDSRLIWGVDE